MAGSGAEPREAWTRHVTFTASAPGLHTGVVRCCGFGRLRSSDAAAVDQLMLRESARVSSTPPTMRNPGLSVVQRERA
jgi:hypothetical protein